MAGRVDRPMLLVVAAPANAAPLTTLFGTRGFMTETVGASAELKRYTDAELNAFHVAIVDFSLKDAYRALQSLHGRHKRPVLIGVGDEVDVTAATAMLDAAYPVPVDPARLFADVVKLVARRKKGKGAHKRLTGVVGVVIGNALFQLVAEELHSIVPPVNAGPILEKALAEIGVNAPVTTRADIVKVLATGALTQALTAFARSDEVEKVSQRIAAIIGPG